MVEPDYSDDLVDLDLGPRQNPPVPQAHHHSDEEEEKHPE